MCVIMYAVIPLCTPLRCYSTIWRNAKNQIVKQINYEKRLIFTTETIADTRARDSLSYGWIYNASLENDTIRYVRIQPTP